MQLVSEYINQIISLDQSEKETIEKAFKEIILSKGDS